MLNGIVLGFYDRGNLGDELFKTVIPIIFQNVPVKLTFKCTDDVDTLPENLDFVICGGGDIINSYFMDKVLALTKDFAKPIYAVSVGISYACDVRYLNIFDHVFVRSKTDYETAIKLFGAKNVDYVPDASMVLAGRRLVDQDMYASLTFDADKRRVGVCLAQPAFSTNANEPQLIDAMVSVVRSLLDGGDKVFLINFNHNLSAKTECDFYVNNAIYSKLKAIDRRYDVVICQGERFYDPMFVLDFISNLDLTVCMRYHSIMMSVIAKVPFVAMYTSQKVGNVIQDLGYAYAYKLTADAIDQPVGIDADRLLGLIKSRAADQTRVPTLPDFDAHLIASTVAGLVYKWTVVDDATSSFESVRDKCKSMICNYLGIGGQEYDEIYRRTGKFRACSDLSVARIVCFAVTGRINSAYIWGFAENMRGDDFNLEESIKYIYYDSNDNSPKEVRYYPHLGSSYVRKTFVNMDFAFQDDFKAMHRSGWSYVIAGMMQLDGRQFSRCGEISVDNFVDRTFLWGSDTLKSMGVIPYKNPWVGFIHHTFDTSCTNNCIEMFTNPLFLASLSTCRALIALSVYLRDQVREYMTTMNITGVPVYAMTHPMETVSNKFTLNKFIANKSRMLIQVGAWLRNSYGIYEFPLYANNPLNMTKAALRGNSMDCYFKPPDFLPSLDNFLLSTNSETIPCNQSGPCRPNKPNRPCGGEPCRGEPCGDVIANKYVSGLWDTVVRNDASVEILEKLDNDEYDDLLSRNIVFLNLVDCSAVNTVLECIVRNTPIIVNRLPALEEVLGPNYPGFYDDYNEAYASLTTIQSIRNITNYLAGIDKEKFSLEYFVNQLQDITLAVSHGHVHLDPELQVVDRPDRPLDPDVAESVHEGVGPEATDMQAAESVHEVAEPEATDMQAAESVHGGVGPEATDMQAAESVHQVAGLEDTHGRYNSYQSLILKSLNEMATRYVVATAPYR